MPAARFAVKDVGEITHRGRVVVGDILAGSIKVGMWAAKDGSIADGPWRIAGVEFADNPSRNESHIGLVLVDAPPLSQLREILVPGSILLVSEQGERARLLPI